MQHVDIMGRPGCGTLACYPEALWLASFLGPQGPVVGLVAVCCLLREALFYAVCGSMGLKGGGVLCTGSTADSMSAGDKSIHACM